MDAQSALKHFYWLHQHPELGLQEYETSAYLKTVLQAEGVRLLDTGMETGALAVVGGRQPGRVIGLRCDIDALPVQEESGLPYASLTPGRMHACGHDFHAAVMLAAAALLHQREEALPGTVKLVFQPAEEIVEGARQLLATGLLDNVEEFYGIHTYPGFEAGTVGIKAGPVMAEPDYFRILLRGRGSHAAKPEEGVDPVPAAAALTLQLQGIVSRSLSPFESAVVTVGHLEAGNTWNVIPENALLEGTVRTLDIAVRDRVRQRMEELVRGTAAAWGCEGELTYTLGCPPVINDPALCEAAREVALRCGLKLAEQEDTMGGENFSEYLQRCPGAFLRIGTGGGYPNHHPRFTADPAALWPAAQFVAELALARLTA